eukprot:SAG31_NODE_3707_length_3970_cov_8.036941_5_plen_174_part_00
MQLDLQQPGSTTPLETACQRSGKRLHMAPRRTRSSSGGGAQDASGAGGGSSFAGVVQARRVAGPTPHPSPHACIMACDLYSSSSPANSLVIISSHLSLTLMTMVNGVLICLWLPPMPSERISQRVDDNRHEAFTNSMALCVVLLDWCQYKHGYETVHSRVAEKRCFIKSVKAN